MPSDSQPTTETRNDWKATVRDIFDATLLHENATGNPFADRVRRMIQERHYNYFCGGKTRLGGYDV